MPEAIATTKRKFYKALDALTNSSQGSLNQPNSATTATKRTSTAAVAFDEARERARKRLRHSTSGNSLADRNASVISLPHKTPIKTARDPAGPPPNFSPWSQETFLARLKTFSSVSQWHPKPDAVNEVEWAKRGWVCVDVNTVACRGGCERRVVVSLDLPKKPADKDEQSEVDEDEEAAALEEALAERYKDEIVNGHASNCLWYKAGCKDDIYRLPVVRPTVWQPELCKRFRSLLVISASIEKVKTRTLDLSTKKLLKEFTREILKESEIEKPNSAKAFEIAMHGWRGTLESGNDLLNCDACFQRVGLWMYQPEYKRSRRSSEEENDEDDTALIDLVEMHREHCPWRNPDSQKATGSLSGLNACQILHKVVASSAKDHRRRSREVEEVQPDVETDEPALTSPPAYSREEVARQDAERESRMQKLKNIFNIKRRSTTKSTAKPAAGSFV